MILQYSDILSSCYLKQAADFSFSAPSQSKCIDAKKKETSQIPQGSGEQSSLFLFGVFVLKPGPFQRSIGDTQEGGAR